jgi:hypothetical protein
VPELLKVPLINWRSERVPFASDAGRIIAPDGIEQDGADGRIVARGDARGLRVGGRNAVVAVEHELPTSDPGDDNRGLAEDGYSPASVSSSDVEVFACLVWR